MPDMRVSGERFAFDEDVWAEEVGRLSATGLAHADRPGARIAVRPCESEGPDGTLLAGCAKAYVPLEVEPSRGHTVSCSRSGFVPTAGG